MIGTSVYIYSVPHDRPQLHMTLDIEPARQGNSALGEAITGDEPRLGMGVYAITFSRPLGRVAISLAAYSYSTCVGSRWWFAHWRLSRLASTGNWMGPSALIPLTHASAVWPGPVR